MKLVMLNILVLVSTGAFSAPSTSFQFDSWVGHSLEKLYTDGILESAHWHTRPKSRFEVAKRLDDVLAKPSNRLNVQLYGKLLDEFSLERTLLAKQRGGRFKVRGSIQVRKDKNAHRIAPALLLAARYFHVNGLTFYQEFEVAKNSTNKHPKQGKTAGQRVNPWYGGYVGDFSRVFVVFPIASGFRIKVGRDAIFWGAGMRSAIGISDNSPNFDLISLQGQIGPVMGTAFAAKLDPMWATQPRRYLANRYLAGHRLDWQVSRTIQMAISELVLYSGEQRSLEWYYINPILPYYASQYNSENNNRADSNDNVMFLFDFSFRPLNGWRLWAEFLVDDFSYTSRDDPNDLAIVIGAELANLLSNKQLVVSLTYTRVNRWTYTHLVETNSFTHFGSVIGHRIGNDADLATIKTDYWVNQDWLICLRYQLERQGAADIGDRFEGENEHHSIRFPSGQVKKQNHLSFDFFYEPILSKTSRRWQKQCWQICGSYQFIIANQDKEELEETTTRQHQLVFQLRCNFELAGVNH